jgi:CRISPR-associated protein Cas1
MTDESLWPARNVAEYAYCPRLFYLMEVEGIFLPSVDTEQGVAVHKRVDRPSTKPSEASSPDPNRPKSIRSLSLSSKTLGLTAVLDLAELTGNTAVPIEYRKGRPKRNTIALPNANPDDAEDQSLTSSEPWPTDRVQVGFQAILLKEAGYEVKKAILYYASEKTRLEIEVTDGLIKEALATLESARSCACGSRPLPLVNDNRCIRCSLQPVCLPDEVNYQRTAEPPDEMAPRKIWPPRDDGIHVVAQSYGTKIGVRGMSMRITDKDGVLLKEIPISNIESLSILGPIQLTTQALHALAEKCIPVAYLSSAGRLVAIVDPIDSVSASIRRAQIKKIDDPRVCLEIARALISAKISNQRTLLMRNCENIAPSALDAMAEELKHVGEANSIESVRGHEGQAAAIYFEHFAGMFKGPLSDEFRKNGRQRRPPPDPINGCISMAYSMLTHECVAALRLASLEPTIGAFHVSKPGRPAFALDLMEPFRPLIADSIAVSAFNRVELTEGHFQRSAAGCILTDAGRRAFFNAYGRRMETDVTHPVFEYRLSYRRMLVLHARMIAAWFLDEIPNLSFLTTR